MYAIHEQLFLSPFKKPRKGINKGVMLISKSKATGNFVEGAITVCHSISKPNKPKNALTAIQ
jgi:hypothetical protein